ncbi:MAG: RIP metalloprotease RseP, partial [Clostridia bacterium]|nr:RIP metalloprotease RseP [Clostridia bacterium]
MNLLLTLPDLKTKIIPIVIAILFFGVIITIHEFGHFIFAKLFGVKVNEFAIGMGPTILKKQGKETKYALRLLPIGGFVSMEGEEEESEDSRAFCNQKTWKRMIIIAAGATFNIILGIIVCFFLVGSEELVGTNEILQFYETAVSNQQGGLQAGDKIIEIDGKRVFSDYDISFLMQRNSSGTYSFVVEREGEKVELPEVNFARRTGGNFSYDENCVISSVGSKIKGFGLDDGDKILKVNGEAVANGEELIAAIGKDEDYTYDFTVEREGEVLEFSEVKMAVVTVFDFVILGEEKNVINVTKNAFGYALSMGRLV